MEKWKSIAGYEGLYEVSDLGRVRSLAHPARSKKGSLRTSPGRIMSAKEVEGQRPKVHLSKDGRVEWHSIHRLVARAFCPGYFEGAEVNHKDENPLNNRADNLEWCTRSYNCSYGHRNDKMKEQRRKAIRQLTLKGEIVATFPMLNEAARTTKVNAAHICDACKGRRSQAGGYKWEYIEEVGLN